MAATTPSPEVIVLRIAAVLAAFGLVASGVVAMLMEMDLLPATRTRYAVDGIVALAFVNWLVRLLLELGTRTGPRDGAQGGGSRQSHGVSVYDWFRQRRRQRRAI